MTNNFKKYFEKLNINSKEPSLELLKELQRKHIATFSFNNIAVLLGKEISLDLESVYAKIVIKNFGGYCFEHNLLMYEVLKFLGFNVRILVAKVLNNKDVDVPRTHRITLVEWEGKSYLLDVGFGAKCPLSILNIHETVVDEGYRITSLGKKTFQLELLIKKGYFTLYAFDLAIYTEADCAMGNFYSSTHPSAVFVNNFVIALRRSAMTLSFRNGSYYRIGKDKTEIREIKSVEELYLMMNKDFAIPLSLVECRKLFEYNNV